jgi:hypothetical protein
MIDWNGFREANNPGDKILFILSRRKGQIFSREKRNAGFSRAHD